MNTDKLIRLPEVIKLTGLSRSTIYKLLELGQFPKQVRISFRAMAWSEKEIQEWISQRIMHYRKRTR